MKNLVNRIRKADKRDLAIGIALAAVFGALNYGLAKLIGLIVDSNPHYVAINDAATTGYLMGFLWAFLALGWMRRADKAVRSRFGRKTSDTVTE